MGSINSFFSLLNGQNPLTHHSTRMPTGHSRIRAAKLHFFSHLEHILCLIFRGGDTHVYDIRCDMFLIFHVGSDL